MGPQVPDKKECWLENREKNKNLDYKFWAVDLEFGDDVLYLHVKKIALSELHVADDVL
jgi:hypothetical protein